MSAGDASGNGGGAAAGDGGRRWAWCWCRTAGRSPSRWRRWPSGWPEAVPTRRWRAAGGTPDGGLGTSSELIIEAARRVDRGAGVAILVDLGSAVLTVKALIAEGDELPEGARLVDAPFVEGAVAAVVTASAGADLDAVATAAHEAYGYRKE